MSGKGNARFFAMNYKITSEPKPAGEDDRMQEMLQLLHKNLLAIDNVDALSGSSEALAGEVINS